MLITLTTLFALLTTSFGFLYVTRLRMEYNTEGTFFDTTSGIVYHEQSVLVFGILTFALLLLTIFTAWKLKKIVVSTE